MSALPQIGPDPAYSLAASGNLPRRQLISRVFVGLTTIFAGAAVTVLGILVYFTAHKGLSQWSVRFFTSSLPSATGGPGGIGPAILGTAELVALSTLVALPVGLLTAVALAEFAPPRVARPLSIALELMAGLPTIVIGIFIAALITNHHKFGQSAWAGAIALSIVQIPLIARASLEAISRVPPTLREAADALGIAHWRTVVGVILPSSSNGIATAAILATARAAGETAPIIFTCGLLTQTVQLNPLKAVPTLPLTILDLFESQYSSSINDAWGAAFFLISVILVTNIGVRFWLRRSERKRGI
jgi:phosphate transport system permease protein